jgi:hypothetical protein
MIEEKKRYIAPGGWFAMEYPAVWSEFEDSTDAFLFYNPDKWTGNFRISAFRNEIPNKKGIHYGDDACNVELKENKSAEYVKIGKYDCAYSAENFEEEGKQYITHIWITGKEDTLLECTFTTLFDSHIEDAQDIIASIDVRHKDRKYPSEIIPARLSEIYRINDAFEKISAMVKEMLSKDFQGSEGDLQNIQLALDKNELSTKKSEIWINVGIVVCCILATEIDGMEWQTLIDGNREDPVLVYQKSIAVIDPLKLIWSKVKHGEKWSVTQVYEETITSLE